MDKNRHFPTTKQESVTACEIFKTVTKIVTQAVTN
jgi:hypothetical protein